MYIPTDEPEFADHHSLVIDLFDFQFSHGYWCYTVYKDSYPFNLIIERNYHITAL